MSTSVTLIVGLPPRLTSFWIISFQISSQISSNFLSNSPFPPSPASRLEQLKPPCHHLHTTSRSWSCFWSYGQNTEKLSLLETEATMSARSSTSSQHTPSWSWSFFWSFSKTYPGLIKSYPHSCLEPNMRMVSCWKLCLVFWAGPQASTRPNFVNNGSQLK